MIHVCHAWISRSQLELSCTECCTDLNRFRSHVIIAIHRLQGFHFSNFRHIAWMFKYLRSVPKQKFWITGGIVSFCLWWKESATLLKYLPVIKWCKFFFTFLFRSYSVGKTLESAIYLSLGLLVGLGAFTLKYEKLLYILFRRNNVTLVAFCCIWINRNCFQNNLNYCLYWNGLLYQG